MLIFVTTFPQESQSSPAEASETKTQTAGRVPCRSGRNAYRLSSEVAENRSLRYGAPENYSFRELVLCISVHLGLSVLPKP